MINILQQTSLLPTARRRITVRCANVKLIFYYRIRFPFPGRVVLVTHPSSESRLEVVLVSTLDRDDNKMGLTQTRGRGDTDFGLKDGESHSISEAFLRVTARPTRNI